MDGRPGAVADGCGDQCVDGAVPRLRWRQAESGTADSRICDADFFIGCGAVIASLLPTLFSDVFGFSNESLNGTIPDTVRYSFYAGGAIYFLAVMWTVFFSYELPPADLQAFQAARQKKSEWLT
jgi:hypothetical protein